MNKKFLSVILFSALMVGTAGTFTSCKDYDDAVSYTHLVFDYFSTITSTGAGASSWSGIAASRLGCLPDVYKRQINVGSTNRRK